MSKATGVPMQTSRRSYRKFDILRQLKTEWGNTPVNKQRIHELQEELKLANYEYQHPLSSMGKARNTIIKKKRLISAFNGTYMK